MMPRIPKKSFADQQRDVQANLAGKELMFGDLRIAKGRRELGRQEIAPKKVRQRSTEPSEHALQKAVIDWWGVACKKYCLPNYALFAVPNAGKRDVIAASILKSEGMRKGAPDLILASPAGTKHGLMIEMKTRTGTQSDEQKEFMLFLGATGYQYSLCRSTESAIDTIKAYLGN